VSTFIIITNRLCQKDEKMLLHSINVIFFSRNVKLNSKALLIDVNFLGFLLFTGLDDHCLAIAFWNQ
jgi:hypothetical protein